MTNIYVIRHGQSQGNLNDWFVGHSDIDLTGLGYEQAELTAIPVIFPVLITPQKLPQGGKIFPLSPIPACGRSSVASGNVRYL